MKLCCLLCLFFAFHLQADVKSLNGKIEFDINSDSSAEMILNSTGLGVGVTATANLHIQGNGIVSDQLFVGGSSGSDNLNIHGSIGYQGIQRISGDTTLSGNSKILVDTSSSNVTLILPSASSVSGREYSIKKVSDLNDVWIYADTALDDEFILNLTSEAKGYSFASLLSDGAQWYVSNLSANASFVDFIPEDLILWLDADDVDGDGTAEALGEGNIVSGNLVDYWIDKSPTASHFSQATGGSQPTLIPAGQNGKASVYFDGTDDFVKVSGFNQTSTQQQVFMAFTLVSGVSPDTFISGDNDRGNIRITGATAFRDPGVSTDTNDFAHADGVSRIDGSVGVTFTTNNAHVLSLNRGSSITSNPYVDMAIGRASSAIGRYPEFELHELLIYKRVLSDAERSIVENYLKDKWGTP